jgi:arabinosaccharide transport system substrate-binding protein
MRDWSIRRLIALLAVSVVVMSACGGAAIGTPESTAAFTPGPSAGGVEPSATTASSEPVALTQWVAANGVSKTFYETIFADYQKEHPNVSLTVEEFPFFDQHDKLRVALEAGTGAPDLSDVEISRFGLFVKGSPTLVDLTDRLAPYSADLVQARQNAYTYQGRVYGVEACVCPVVLYYRDDIFQDAGIQTPITTWDEFRAAGKLLKEKTGKAMLSLEVTDYDAWTPLMLQFGGGFFDVDGNVVLDSPENLKAFTQYIDWVRKDGIAIPAAGGDQYNPNYWAQVNAGDVAAIYGADWMSGIIKGSAPDTAGKWKAQALPTSPDAPIPTSTVGGTALTITNQAKNVDAAFDWLKYAMLRKESLLTYYEMQGILPQFKPAWDDPALQAADPFFGGQEIGKFFMEQAALLDSPTAPYLPQAPDIPTAYDVFVRTALGPAMDGSKTPEQALKEAAAELKSIIGQ